ncbi:D-arabinitol 2-dehydrogenase [Purpureocillium lavendulum]|uniref:D-arabinitol 2-dehydrogenase n=1 Tax=Purpureocillium lavendulum TaxID=1247861 RepID=A0AB34FXV4_9HYPO|nr:D-arabinitol 2-dehydrogenase [Purpureocillium lavendulum]
MTNPVKQPAADDMSGPEDNTLSTQPEVSLRKAGLAIVLLESYLPEVELLLQRMKGRVKSPQTTGLPAWIRDLRKTQVFLAEMRSNLPAAVDDSTLDAISRRLDACAVNASHGQTQWDILKRCRSFVGVNQSFQGSDKDTRKREIARVADLRGGDKQRLHRTLKEQAKVEVDVVDGGAEWLAIRTLQPDRLARQMTDSGWDWGEHSVGDDVDESEWDDVPLAKQVRRLAAAARINRHEYRVPRIRVVLPNISRRESEDVDVLLSRLSRIDPAVQVSFEDKDSDFLQRPVPPLSNAIEHLLGHEFDGLTETLNVDHTILIDLISDITHARLQPQPWQEETTRAQIVEENLSDGGVMAQTLYPILDGRKLVCTKEAAEHFHEVLRTVGTSTERERGRLLVPFDNDIRQMSDVAIRSRFKELSIHELPITVQLPLCVHDQDWDVPSIERAIADGRLPPVALDVAGCAGFKSSKLSTYMHGWATDLITITSNKEVRGQIRTWVEANRRDEGDYGPRIWRVNTTRNLLAKSATPRGSTPPDYEIAHRGSELGET